MIKKQLLAALFLALFGLISTGTAQTTTVIDTIFDRKAHEADFAFGADIGFVSQMESWGTKWQNKHGAQKDILQILKEQGINNVRLRVWVNPAGGWCGKNDVVKMAKRAHSKGMGIMLCFHYSDTWADPGTQDRPAAWANYTMAQLEQALYDHTHDIISALKAEGITPKWAQIGNETKRGMFYPTAQTNKGGTDNFAKLLKSGIKAVKDIDTSIKTIVHLPDGHDNSLFRSMFDNLKNRGVKWDIIGMSAYPRWSHLDGPEMIKKVMYNVNDLKKRYNTPVMVVETGHYWHKPIEANHYLVQLMDTLINIGQPGVFYWEPESMSGYELGAWDPDTKRPTVAMDAFLGLMHTEVSWVIKANMTSPKMDDAITSGGVLLSADAKHVRNHQINVEFYVDNIKKQTISAPPYELVVEDIEPGRHKAYAKVYDNAGNTLQTDVVNFVYGESADMGIGTIVNGNQKGGSVTWMADFKQPGEYKLVLGYSSSSFSSAEVTLADSTFKTYFMNKSDYYQDFKINVKTAGMNEIKFVSTNTKGLPEINSLVIFPMEGQQLPTLADATGIENIKETEDEIVEVYSLSGVLQFKTSASQLGVSLGAKSSGVFVLPNSVGGTPYIVRKQRLK